MYLDDKVRLRKGQKSPKGVRIYVDSTKIHIIPNKNHQSQTYQFCAIISCLLCLVPKYIPQGTGDNLLGPDRLAGPKALEINFCRQPTL